MTDISDYMDPARVDPTCKQHRPTKLYATPPKDATDLRLGAILGHYDDWYVCTCCGAVAYQGRRRLRWGSIMSDDIKRRAIEFNKRVANATATPST